MGTKALEDSLTAWRDPWDDCPAEGMPLEKEALEDALTFYVTCKEWLLHNYNIEVLEPTIYPYAVDSVDFHWPDEFGFIILVNVSSCGNVNFCVCTEPFVYSYSHRLNITDDYMSILQGPLKAISERAQSVSSIGPQ